MISLIVHLFLLGPMEAKPFPPRPPLPDVVNVQLNYPNLLDGSNVVARGDLLLSAGYITSGEYVPIRTRVFDMFTDSCGVLTTAVEWYDLAPYEMIAVAHYLPVTTTTCTGLGFLERYVMVDGQLASMHYTACAAAGLPPSCRARLDVPVWVEP